MMRWRVLLAIFPLLNAWAGACSIAGPSPKVKAAGDQLSLAKAANQALCKAQPTVNCTVYDTSAAKVAVWLADIDGIASQKVDQWTVTHDPRYGRVTTIRSVSNLTVAETVDRQTAYEKLSAHLNQSKRPQWMWWNCNLAGITDSAYQLSECRWVKDRSGDLITFQVKSAQDNSLLPGQYQWQGNDCGDSLIGPKNQSITNQ